MASHTTRNFMKQQGFSQEADPVCDMHFKGLNLQPRVVAVLVLLGTIFRWPAVFLVLSAVLWWSALVPALNPFELFYNGLLASRHGPPLLTPAPAPRRFAQGMAGTMALIIGVALLLGWTTMAAIFEVLFLVAVAALLFGRLCIGAYVYHLLCGKHSFANATLPWVRSR
jgi:hypothetical protein